MKLEHALKILCDSVGRPVPEGWSEDLQLSSTVLKNGRKHIARSLTIKEKHGENGLSHKGVMSVAVETVLNKLDFVQSNKLDIVSR